MSVYVNQFIPNVKSDEELPEQYKGLSEYQGVSVEMETFEDAQVELYKVFNFIGPLWMATKLQSANKLAGALVTMILTEEPDFLAEIDGYHWSITNEPRYKVITREEAERFADE